MKKLKLIYESYGLEYPNERIKPLLKYKPKAPTKKAYILEELFFIYSKDILDNKNNIQLDENHLNADVSEYIEKDITYSSRIEGAEVAKTKRPIEHKVWRDIYKYILSKESLSHKTFEDIVGSLMQIEEPTFNMITDNKYSYRKKSVGIYKSGKHGLDELVHQGIDSKSIMLAMTNVINQLNSYTTDINSNIINVAATHFLFEHIHPYYDCNGRIGRLLIYWYLSKTNIRSCLNSLSMVIEMNVNKYYLSLLHSQQTMNLNYFISFFSEVINLSLEVESIIFDLSENNTLTKIQTNFLRKLLILGINKNELCYPNIKSYFNNISKATFFKMINILVDKEILTANKNSKTTYYKL